MSCWKSLFSWGLPVACMTGCAFYDAQFDRCYAGSTDGICASSSGGMGGLALASGGQRNSGGTQIEFSGGASAGGRGGNMSGGETAGGGAPLAGGASGAGTGGAESGGGAGSETGGSETGGASTGGMGSGGEATGGSDTGGAASGGTSAGGTGGMGSGGETSGGSGGGEGTALARLHFNEMRRLASGFVELYNPSTTTSVSLDGYTFTLGQEGSPNYATQCELTGMGAIPPLGFGLIQSAPEPCLGGADCAHSCGFSIEAEDELYILVNHAGIDEIVLSFQYPPANLASFPQSSQSWASVPDGSDDYLATPSTPGSSNQ